MVATTIFFGTTQKMMTLRLPDQGMKAHQVRYAQDLQYENGSADVYQPSTAYHMEYDFNFGAYEASGSTGLDNYGDFAGGAYGPPIVFFSDPMYYDVNILPPNFANPALSATGWKSLGGSSIIPTYSATAANSYNQPYQTATYDTSTLAANTFVTQNYASCIIPIPPSMTLWLGVSGTSTGNGSVNVDGWVNGASARASYTQMPLLSPTGSTRLNQSFSGATYNYVRLGISSSVSNAAGTVSITSMMAQLWPTGTTPVQTGNFQSGQGNNGCKFTTNAIEETYLLRDDQSRNLHLKGLAFGLKEVVRY